MPPDDTTNVVDGADSLDQVIVRPGFIPDYQPVAFAGVSCPGRKGSIE